jgi:CRP/FNR family transcriptional regulator
LVDREVLEAITRSFLGRLPTDLAARLLSEGELNDYPAGSTIYREAAPPRSVLVVSGLVRVYMTSAEGRQVTVRYARQADVLGIAVAVGGPVNVVAQTLAPTSLFSINHRLLTQAAREDAGIAWALAEEIDHRLYDTLQQVALNAFGSVKQRVAAHLLELASAHSDAQGKLIANLSQQDLADSVGSVREVVARVLRDFRLAGIVATSPDSVVILEPLKLHDEAWNI